MFSKLQILFATLIFVLLLFSGCGKFVKFGGKVTDSNGQPYTKGYVIFTNQQFSARGKLQPNGTYKLDSLKDGDGLAPGTYQVYLMGHQTIPIDAMHATSELDDKYEDPSTSGLTCEVVKGGRFDFTVELKTEEELKKIQNKK
ncbi:MAG: hypothetical protein LBF88_09720 [Planctomycetaceae bacterium]|nr:hypothetical protein [Planctomycetaceae bacterium]